MKFKTRHKKQLADLITPVSAYLKLRGNFSELLLLESTDYHSASDSKSFICIEPLRTFSLKQHTLTVQSGKEKTTGDISPETALVKLKEFKTLN